jgi:hypothetical protein
MIIHDVEQGSESWHSLRQGRPTASRFSSIVTAKTGRLSTTSKKYLAELICERLGFETPHFQSEAMLHGIETEPVARSWFELEMDLDGGQVGLVTTDDGTLACSPDGLIYEAGDLVAGWECKCPEPRTHMMYLMDQELPDVYKQQVHGSMFICQVPWYFMSYVEGMEPFVIKVEPDGYTETLGKALEEFAAQLETLSRLHGANELKAA